MKYHIFLGFLAVVAAYPGHHHEESIGESDHHHHVEHEHAKSHQSIKFEHFHPVPVYVKKEHSHLLKEPLEKGKSESSLKLIHPETQHTHGGGLVLEDDRHHTEHHPEHAGFEHESFDHGNFEHHGFEGYGGEELKGYAELSHHQEAEGHHFGEAGDAEEGFKFDSY